MSRSHPNRRVPLVHVIIGTRADAIKMAPIFLELKHRVDVDARLIATGQHKELLVDALRPFDLVPDIDLQVMRHGQKLAEVTGRILDGLDKLFAEELPDAVLVHGDTTTCFAAALAAFYRSIPVVHVEAGLRTHHIASPFPEEANRQLVARFASLHLAPSADARKNLLREGVSAANIRIVGSSAVDALRLILEKTPAVGGPLITHADILITVHRRENHGKLEELFLAIRDTARSMPELRFHLPLHPNPALLESAHRLFGDSENIRIGEPMPFDEFIPALAGSRAVLTDSGGVQEEAMLLGKPVLVLRTSSERKASGSARLMGTTLRDLPKALRSALRKPSRKPRGSLRSRPSAKVAAEVAGFLRRRG